MRYEFHPEALEEFEDAANYYASKEAGLEVRFVAGVESSIRQICEAPTRWRIFEQDIRRSLVRTFPYGVLYSIEPDYVLIIAVTHCSREPGYWKHRRD